MTENWTSTGATNCFSGPENVRETILLLHSTYRLKYEQIAALKAFCGIPVGTIGAIANGADVPRKWYKKLGLHLPRARCLRPPTTEIRKDEAAIAAAQIGRNCYFPVADLIVELSKQLPPETIKELKEKL